LGEALENALPLNVYSFLMVFPGVNGLDREKKHQELARASTMWTAKTTPGLVPGVNGVDRKNNAALHEDQRYIYFSNIPS
jgi:hypothetical protein